MVLLTGSLFAWAASAQATVVTWNASEMRGGDDNQFRWSDNSGPETFMDSRGEDERERGGDGEKDRDSGGGGRPDGVVPEPASLLSAGIGLSLLGLARLKRK